MVNHSTRGRYPAGSHQGRPAVKDAWKIHNEVAPLLTAQHREMARAANPLGDGLAGKRIATALTRFPEKNDRCLVR